MDFQKTEPFKCHVCSDEDNIYRFVSKQVNRIVNYLNFQTYFLVIMRWVSNLITLELPKP